MSEKITVCAACLHASCWQGAFHCEDYRTADTIEKTPEELQKLALEHPSYWDVCSDHGVARSSCAHHHR